MICHSEKGMSLIKKSTIEFHPVSFWDAIEKIPDWYMAKFGEFLSDLKEDL